MNTNLVNQLKEVKKKIVAKELVGDDWEEQQTAVNKLEEVVTYLNDASAKGIGFDEKI
ncbi:MAG: hypothetical protein PHQ72_07095 [Hespellia sp.]|nr:hypothetical protein [Hespellia sp.]